MLRIVMDSAGDIPLEWVEEFNIQIIPVNIHFGERTYLQGVDMSNTDFYRLAEESGIIPKTSQPTPGQFMNFYSRIARPGDTIISVHVTGKLSGTLASAQMAARELAGQYKVIPIDSASGSAVMGFMCREARLMERAGAAIDKIVRRMKAIGPTVSIFLTLKSLEYARKSGRVRALQAIMASMLNIKPIVVLRDGILEVGDKVRTRRRALEYILDATAERMEGRPVYAAVVHSEDPDTGKTLLAKVRGRLNCQDLILTDLSIGIAANLGPGTVGIGAYPVAGG